MHIRHLPRASRMHFLPASVLPFVLGAVYASRAGYNVTSGRFITGLAGIASAHLAGNLFNDFSII